MMQLIPDMPANVIGLIASGHITGEDYERVAIPAVEAALKTHERIRMLYQVASDFDGFCVRCGVGRHQDGDGPFHRMGKDRGGHRCRLDTRCNPFLRGPDAVPGEAVRQCRDRRGERLDRHLRRGAAQVSRGVDLVCGRRNHRSITPSRRESAGSDD